MNSIFTTPVVSHLLRWLSRPILWLSGWTVTGETPTPRKYILIGAPHTSNWDFPLMLLAILSRRMSVKWMGKHTLFKPPFGGLMRWLGGIAIDRTQSQNTVAQMSAVFKNADELALVITPEGTRSKVHKWKTGFYHIAVQSGIPLVLGYVDAANKTCGFGPIVHPSGDLEVDMETIQAFYRGKTGIIPALGNDNIQ